MNACQLDTKKYLTDHADKVAKAKAAKFNAPLSIQKYGDRTEYTFAGNTGFSAAMGLHGSFNKAFPGIINRPRSIQNNTVVTIPTDLNTINRVIQLSQRFKEAKAEVSSDISFDYSKEDFELMDFIKENADTVLDTTDPYTSQTSLEAEQVLSDISENGQTEGLRNLAADMKKLLQETKQTADVQDLGIFYVSPEELDVAVGETGWGKPRGAYMPDSHTIYISNALSTYEAQKVFLHELAHAITERKINSNPELRAEFEKLYNVAKEALKDNPNVNSYRLSSVSEFIAGAFNDRKFMAQLAGIESVNKKAPNILVEFMNLVKRVLGLKDLTLLDDVLYMVEKASMSNSTIDTYINYSPRAEIAANEVIDDPGLKKLWAKQVESINNRIKELEPLSGGEERQEVRRRISILNNSLKELEGRVSYNAIYSVANRDLQTAKYLLNKKDVNAFDINEALRILEDLEGFDSALEDSPLTTELRQAKNEIRKQVVELGSLFRKKFADEILKISRAQGYDMTYEELTKAVKDMNGAEKLFYDSGYSHIPIMRIAASVLDQYKNTVAEKVLEFEAREKEIKAAYKNFDLNTIFENRHLISEYTDDYYDQEREKNAAVSDSYKPIKKLKDAGLEVPSSLWRSYYAALNSRFDWYKANNSYILTAENEERYKKDLEAQKDLLTVNGVVDYEALEQWELSHSPYKNEAGFVNENGKFVFTSKDSPTIYSRWHSYFQVIPNEEFNNPKYAQVKDNPVYNYFREGFIDAFSKIPHQASLDVGTYHKFIRSMEFDLTENSFRFRGLLSGLGDTVNDWYSIKLTLDDVNGIDSTVRDSFGRPKTVIKVPDINSLKDTASDPFDLLKKFYKLAVTYEHKVHASPIADLLYYQLSNIPKIENSITGGMLRRILQGDPLIVEKGLTNAMQNLKYKMGADLSERTRLDEESVMDLSPEEKAKLEEDTLEWINNGAQGPAPTVRKISYVRILDSITDYTRLNLIGLKPMSAVANLVMGISSNYMYAAREKDFKDEHLTRAFNVMFQSMFKFWTHKATVGKSPVVTPDAKKMTFLAQKFGIVTNLYENQSEMGKTDISKAFINLMYLFQESGEYLIHTQLLMAMMYNQKVETLNGETKSLWDAYILSKDSAGNDTLIWDEKTFGPAPEWNTREFLDASGLNNSKLKNFESRIKQVRIDTQGDYQNALLGKSTVWARTFMVFRTWIPSAIRQRFGREIEGEFKGRYRSFTTYFRSNKGGSTGILANSKALGKITAKTFLVAAAKMFNFGPMKYLGFNALSKKAQELYEEDLKSAGLSELEIENMRVNVRELQFILFCLTLAGALKQLADDDDDPTLTFLTNLSQRTYQDLSFFVLPPSTLSVIKDPIPIWSTIENATDLIESFGNYLQDPASDIYKRGRRKGDSKLAKEFSDLVPIWSAYNSTLGTMSQVFDPDSYKYTKNK